MTWMAFSPAKRPGLISETVAWSVHVGPADKLVAGLKPL